MTENECLNKMVAPGTRRPGKYREGVIQIHVTRACDNACYNCTQGSNLGGRTEFITLDNFEKAVQSLKGYFGVVGVFGGNPALHPQFPQLCEILAKHIPWEQRGLWCNNPNGHGKVMQATFNPAVSNLNVHLSQSAWDEFKRDWPESQPCGLKTDSRHSPCYVAMKDIGIPEGERWELISKCDINQHWSAMMGQFRGEIRAWFCEIAGAQAMLHQHEPDYPDTGMSHLPHLFQGTNLRGEYTEFEKQWWELPMGFFDTQVRKHCHDCGVPLKGHGELAMIPDEVGLEQVSETHKGIYKSKRKGRRIELVTVREQLGEPLGRMTNYLGNAKS